MGRLFDDIRGAVLDDRVYISEHADERLRERGIMLWHVLDGIKEAVVIEERAGSRPHPSVLIEQRLQDGTRIRVVWAGLRKSGSAKLVTVYFIDR